MFVGGWDYPHVLNCYGFCCRCFWDIERTSSFDMVKIKKKLFESLIFLQATLQYQVLSFQFEVNHYDRERGFAEWLNKLETVCKLQKVKNLEYLSSSALKWFLCFGLVVRLPCIMSKDTKLNNTALTQALQKSFSNFWALHITKISNRRVGKC